MRIDHLALINPSRAIDNDDCRVDWLTHRNIIEWNKRAKEFLVEIMFIYFYFNNNVVPGHGDLDILLVILYRRVKVPSVRSILYSTT